MGKSGKGKKIIKGIIIMLSLLVSLVFTGCARTKGEYIKLSADVYPPKSEAEEIPLIQNSIDKPYKEIGLVKVKGDRHTKDKERLEKIRQIAKEAGADAVIKPHVEKTERLVFWKSAGKFPQTRTYKVKESVCVGTADVFTENGIS